MSGLGTVGEIVTTETAAVGLLTIPKVASTALRAALLQSAGHDVAAGVHAHEALRRTDSARFVIAFVRHPIDRLVSLWANLVERPTRRGQLSALGYDATMTFSDFVARLLEVGTAADPHTVSQVEYLTATGRWAADFLGRFERIAEDWRRLQRAFGLVELDHLNKSRRPHWRRACTATARGHLRKLYEDDFRLLGYSP